MHSLFFFIVAISILVVIHEFGHFWVARRCGVKVLKFSVGFGPTLWSRVAQDGTEYALSAIPLGGYVKMLDEREAEVDAADLPAAFNRKPLSSRVAIVVAGPLANLLFAVFAYWLVFVIGINGFKPIIGDVVPGSVAAQAGLLAGDELTIINGTETLIWNQVVKQLLNGADQGAKAEITFERNTSSYTTMLSVPKIGPEKVTSLLTELGVEPLRPQLKPVIGKVIKGGVAEQAGLNVGDELTSANNRQLNDWAGWVDLIQQSAGITLVIQYVRNGQLQKAHITPAENEIGKGFIGVAVDPKATEIPQTYFAKVKVSPLAAVYRAMAETWQFSVLTVKGIIGMLTGTVSLDNIGGPISIAQIAGASAENGVISFLQMLAIISISLGVLNLLPIPVLDGGHLVFYLIEAIKGSPVSAASQLMAQKVGMMLLFSLMFLAFFNDLTRLFG